MATVNVYEQYFKADMKANGVKRRGALVMLISDSDAGQIRYEAAVTFFPHKNEEDYAVSYDAYYNKWPCSHQVHLRFLHSSAAPSIATLLVFDNFHLASGTEAYVRNY